MDTHEALTGLMVDGRLDKERAAEALSMLCAAHSQAAIHVRRRARASNSGHMESSSRRTPGSTG